MRWLTDFKITYFLSHPGLLKKKKHEGRSRSIDPESEERVKTLRCISIRLAEKKETETDESGYLFAVSDDLKTL